MALLYWIPVPAVNSRSIRFTQFDGEQPWLRTDIQRKYIDISRREVKTMTNDT